VGDVSICPPSVASSLPHARLSTLAHHASAISAPLASLPTAQHLHDRAPPHFQLHMPLRWPVGFTLPFWGWLPPSISANCRRIVLLGIPMASLLSSPPVCFPLAHTSISVTTPTPPGPLPSPLPPTPAGVHPTCAELLSAARSPCRRCNVILPFPRQKNLAHITPLPLITFELSWRLDGPFSHSNTDFHSLIGILTFPPPGSRRRTEHDIVPLSSASVY
jgi:hypothetical protein